jgi:hypothetical protein
VANWISTHRAAQLAMVDGKICPVDDDRLRELVLLGEFPPQGEDLFGNTAILRSYLPTLGRDYHEARKRHSRQGSRLDFLHEGELTPKMVHDLLPSIPYKHGILEFFGSGAIEAVKCKGRYVTTQESFQKFLEDAAQGKCQIPPEYQVACRSCLSQML